MSMKLYELAGADSNRRFSPYCWRVKYAIAHKGITPETDFIRFTEKSAIAHSGSPTVPVIDDGDTSVSDSFEIAKYLDEAYPDAPKLMGSDVAIGQARLIESWANTQIMAVIFRMIILDIFEGLDEGDKEYFRETREKRVGSKLEEFQKYDDEQIQTLFNNLTPVRMMLKTQPFLSGDTPGYADYILMGCFMFARASSTKKFLKDDDSVNEWYENMLDMYDGLGRKVKVS
ncbi:glutathione S-transferase N-terminal domain-containing protein [Curvivirga sp.]|uniref:glutathione S-transferase N-terminal domain-containing protein n=1 Tax=Curvivirga sp. TaxID=2856848 RepID=UPI003B5C17FD